MFNNIPPNGFPQIPDIEDLEAVVEDVKTLKTTAAVHAVAITGLENNKDDTTNIAPTFSADSNYSVGDLVYYEGTLYECTTAHEATAWDAEDFTAATIAGEINGLNSKITTVDDGVITPETGVSLTSYALKKSINTVSISALVQLTPTLGTNNTIGVMPSSFKPSADRVYITCVNATSDKLVIGYVDKYGGIYIYPTSNDSSAVAQNYYISGAFVVG